MVITVIVFVFRMGRAGVLESTFTAREVRSNRARPVPDRAILRAEGPRVRGYRLQGYLFFGGGYPLADRLKESLGDDPRPLCILLDFTAVTGLDFSTVNAMCRFILAARGAGTEVVLGGAPDTLAGELRRNLPPPVYGKLVFAADADSALQHCEDKLLADWQPDGNARVSRSSLLEAVGDEMQRNLDRGLETIEISGTAGTRDYGPGESLLAAGEASDVLQFIVDGRISILDAAGVRIREIGPGMPVNPHAAFDATASAITAVAESPCRTATLDSLALRLLEESDRALALRLYRFLLSAPAPDANPEPPGEISGAGGQEGTP